MIGLLLISISTFFIEIGSSIGKLEVRNHKESIYTMGFLSFFLGTVFILLIGFVRDSFVFSSASIPTLLIKIVLEIMAVHVVMLAIVRADRSTFGFLRIITIPLLLAVDLSLGYTISQNQMIGIGIIIFGFIILFINHGVRKKGAGLVILASLFAVATISLYKYHITYFNSVETEQGIILVILTVYSFVMAFFVAKENPIKFLKKPIFLLQSVAAGIATVLFSFAYVFAPASIITVTKRSFSILWTMISGNLYFHEKHFLIKFISFAFIVGGLVFLVI